MLEIKYILVINAMNINNAHGAFSLKQKIVNTLNHVQQSNFPPLPTVRKEKE